MVFDALAEFRSLKRITSFEVHSMRWADIERTEDIGRKEILKMYPKGILAVGWERLYKRQNWEMEL